MEYIEEHYMKLLGLADPWEVEAVRLSVKGQRLDVELSYGTQETLCPVCGQKCPVYDQQAERTWRHLDTMQFETYIHSKTPRANCPKHGVKNIEIPWAHKHSRFTLLFEAFALQVLQICKSTEDARKHLRLNWHQVEDIKQRAVQRGLARREAQEIPWIGIDEKSFLKGQSYVSVLNDIDGARVLDVVEGRDEPAAEQLLKQGLSEYQREMVCAVAIDMSAAYIHASETQLPNADIVHDHFHISMHLNDSVDLVRRQEHRELCKKNDQRLKGSRFLWLQGFEHMSQEDKDSFIYLRNSSLKVAKAWSLKELFNHFWTMSHTQSASHFFARWFDEVMKSGLAPMKKVAKMLRKHLQNILTYFDSYLTNAISEGFNSKIQAIKSNARGYRSFENFRISILFHCGKLDMAP